MAYSRYPSVFRRTLNTVLIGVMVSVFGLGALTGCGQKGALYLQEDAPSNTDFILYKQNKEAMANQNNNQQNETDNKNKVSDSTYESDITLSDDPQDY